MRARNIKPGFFKNEDLAELGPWAMLLFAGLWLLADRSGRLEDRPPRIRAEIFPYAPRTNVVSLLASLAAKDFIVRYEANGCKYIEIAGFVKHQNPHINEAKSTIPAPCSAPPKDGTSTVPLALIPDSLIPDSSHTDSPIACIPSVRAVAPFIKQALRAADLNGQTSQKFEDFWTRYPRKQHRDAACMEWLSVVTVESEPQVFGCLSRYLASDEVARGAVQNPEKWLMEQHRDGWAGDWPKFAPRVQESRETPLQTAIRKAKEEKNGTR